MVRIFANSRRVFCVLTDNVLATIPRLMRDAIEERVTVLPKSSRVSIGQDYPKWRYHWTRKEVLVKNSDEERALGGGWANMPAAFDAYKGARPARTEQQNPVKWVDEWLVPGLCSVPLLSQLTKRGKPERHPGSIPEINRIVTVTSFNHNIPPITSVFQMSAPV